MRKLIPLIALLALAGCSDERVAYQPTQQQSITLEVAQDWPWSPYVVSVVLYTNPDCQRLYPLQNVPKDWKPFEVYAYQNDGSYALIVEGQKYLLDIPHCEVTHFKDIPDLKSSDKRGEFLRDSSGALTFALAQVPQPEGDAAASGAK